MVTGVHDILERGPEAVIEWFAHQARSRTLDDLDAKLLADVCWTEASAAAKTSAGIAVKWARAALAGYDFLIQHGQPAVAESARESASRLRTWRILASNQA